MALEPKMPHEKQVELEIQSSRGIKKFTFPEEEKISGVIATAATAFGFSPSDTFRLVLKSKPSEPLQPDRTLVSYHIVDGTVLILTDVGSGV
jgi:hypothetical protein